MFSRIRRFSIFNCCKNNKNKNNKNKNNNKNNHNAYVYSNAIENISYLENVSYKDTIPFIPPIIYAKVIKVYDGDTITVASKMPFTDSPIYRFSVRLAHIDSPEIKGQSNKETKLAIISRNALHKLIFGKVVELKNNGKEKYGRLLADIYYNDIYVNKWMIDNKYAIKYEGGTKIRPDNWD